MAAITRHMAAGKNRIAMALEKYTSKQVQLNRPDWLVYNLLSDFNTFTPLLEGRVDGWRVEGDTCSFTVKGFSMTLRMAEKTPYTTLKISGEGGSPFGFALWIQLVRAGENDTRLRLTLHAELNMMMKMMVGKKLEQGLDQLADGLAMAFNLSADQMRRMAAERGWSLPDSAEWPLPDPDKPVS